MSYPNAIEVCRAELFTKEVELREHYPQALVDKVLRVREMYNWFIANPDGTDREFVAELCQRHGITARRLIPTLPWLSRCCRCLEAQAATSTGGAPTKNSTRLSSLGDLPRTAQRSPFPNRPAFSTTNTIPLSPDGSLDTHINRSHDAQLRRLYPRTR